MGDSETLAALKRAYADTILNTTKEAAARVLCSEKKTRMYQQEIKTVRDDAVNTLLRLKHMYDSKIKETEEMSLKQQQKVEELEAQLGEAEDIVGELRMELRALHDEFNRVTNAQTSYLNGDHQEPSCLKNSNAAGSVVPKVSSGPERSGVANGITNPSLTRINSIKRCSSKGNMDRCHHTLPSILTKRREVEGYAQMFHSVDKRLANGDLSSSVEVEDVNDGVCLQKVSSCKSVETLELSGCADITDPMVSQNTSQMDFGTPIPLETFSKEHEQNRKSMISGIEARNEEKESCGNIEVLTSPSCEETPVLAASKNRSIKYTFKRKRKKEALSNLEGDSTFEESRNIKQKTGEKDDGYLESLKPSFTSESSRDALCVAQVARQLEPYSKQNGFAAELVNQ
ncbi:unnamed protein product [Eruca vesicaria subsp. sativa]|uniref:Uncharacterized protein n=1 Tax=Eruca vesicaria subsp. sativa TaxID=29727 RepID=A0ABC8KI70_ERUVS|nr:unnamed protein product [Eruca vesicaria subsp. sativa]